jgi:hypothetical protein
VTCREPVVFNVRRGDRSGDYYFVCAAHVSWAQGQFAPEGAAVVVRAIRSGEVTSGCVGPDGLRAQGKLP